MKQTEQEERQEAIQPSLEMERMLAHKQGRRSMLWQILMFTLCVCALAALLLGGWWHVAGLVRTERMKMYGGRGSEELIDIGTVSHKLEDIEELLNTEYLYDMDAGKMEEGIYRGLLASLYEDDPYANYFTADEVKEMESELSGHYTGIGVSVESLESGGMQIVKVFEGSSAKEVGLRVGDEIWAVDGVDITDKSQTEIIRQLIRGEAGTSVKIGVYRGDKRLEFECERREIDIPVVHTQLLDGEEKIAYLRLDEFAIDADKQFIKGLTDLQAQGMKKLIVDLRDNPGGNVDSVYSMIDYILEDDNERYTALDERFDRYNTLLFYMESRSGELETWYAEDGHELDIPIVVLINENSASASELFSGCLRDYGRARLVGTKSYGKGISQSMYPLKDGSALYFTRAYYYLPSGNNIHKKGLEPDVRVEMSGAAESPDMDAEVASESETQESQNTQQGAEYAELTVNPERDIQLQKALELIRTMQK